MHIFIMSKIRHSHRQYDMRKRCGTKHRLNRAKVWLVGHITLADRPCVGAFSKTILSTCQAEMVPKASSAQRWCKEETWPAGLTSGPHTPNHWPQHHLTPPINTMVLPPAEGVKRVRFSPLYCSQVHSCRVERERGEVLRAGGLLSMSEVLGVAQSQRLCWNPFGFHRVFRGLVQSSAVALPEFYLF
jgi:hypothetical protein